MPMFGRAIKELEGHLMNRHSRILSQKCLRVWRSCKTCDQETTAMKFIRAASREMCPEDLKALGQDIGDQFGAALKVLALRKRLSGRLRG